MSRTEQISAAIDALVSEPERDAQEQRATPAAPARPRASAPVRRGRLAAAPLSRPAQVEGQTVAPERSGGALSVQIDSELLEACRDAVAFLSGPPLHLTLRAFVEAALRDRLHTELTRARGLELLEEDADAFPPRGQALRVGRPLVRA